MSLQKSKEYHRPTEFFFLHVFTYDSQQKAELRYFSQLNIRYPSVLYPQLFYVHLIHVYFMNLSQICFQTVLSAWYII